MQPRFRPRLADFRQRFDVIPMRMRDENGGDRLRIVRELVEIFAVGVICHVGLIYLLPAAAFVTLAGSSKGLSRLGAGLIGAALALTLIIVVTYYQAGQSLEFSQSILFASGKPPHSVYFLP